CLTRITTTTTWKTAQEIARTWISRITARTILRTVPRTALRTVLRTSPRIVLRTALRTALRTILRIIPRTAAATAAEMSLISNLAVCCADRSGVKKKAAAVINGGLFLYYRVRPVKGLKFGG
ncbi:MAG: hypothetical protein LIP15_16695, partial [Clostridium sp.]|nr:hypothetical protein [Clostridium sp.]